ACLTFHLAALPRKGAIHATIYSNSHTAFFPRERRHLCRPIYGLAAPSVTLSSSLEERNGERSPFHHPLFVFSRRSQDAHVITVNLNPSPNASPNASLTGS